MKSRALMLYHKGITTTGVSLLLSAEAQVYVFLTKKSYAWFNYSGEPLSFT